MVPRERIGIFSHECSIIEGDEKNKLSFYKEPSFLQQKENSDSFPKLNLNSEALILNSKYFADCSKNE